MRRVGLLAGRMRPNLWPLHYGVWSEDAELTDQLESLRDTGRSFRIWGTLTAGLPGANANQIVVTRIELLD